MTSIGVSVPVGFDGGLLCIHGSVFMSTVAYNAAIPLASATLESAPCSMSIAATS